uniref:Uncharacterized protein n=1 Tax=viral metagenome TaxID=1070528 RepID=A0A6C0JBC3_9ZZZZ
MSTYLRIDSDEKSILENYPYDFSINALHWPVAPKDINDGIYNWDKNTVVELRSIVVQLNDPNLLTPIIQIDFFDTNKFDYNFILSPNKQQNKVRFMCEDDGIMFGDWRKYKSNMKFIMDVGTQTLYNIKIYDHNTIFNKNINRIIINVSLTPYNRTIVQNF